MTVCIDGDLLLAHLDELAESARGPGKTGVTRLAWSPADLAGRALLASGSAGRGSR